MKTRVISEELVDATRDENGLALTTAALEVLDIVLKQFDDTDRLWDKSNDGLPVPSAADYAADIIRKLRKYTHA